MEKIEKFHFAFEDIPSVMKQIYAGKNNEMPRNNEVKKEVR